MAYYTNKITPTGVTKEEITGKELETLEAEIADWNSKANDRKLEVIKQLRLDRLQSTDYMANSDVTMPDYIKTWRQSLRDIPANNDSSKYDDLLKRDDNGNLTHTIWTQPTE